MYEPLQDAGRWIASVTPQSIKARRPRLNFLTVHYLYMLGMSIIGSIMLYPAGLLSYTDSLFFAAGMATQSGLNTVNVNELHTYQQVVMMLLTCICTPIFINTFVVFVRLYWFEKRFEHMVKEIRGQRRTKTRSISSRSKSQMKENSELPDLGRLEKGVNGRPITILRDAMNDRRASSSPSPDRADESGDSDKHRLQNGTSHELAALKGMADHYQSVNPTPEGSRQDSDRESGPVHSDEKAAEGLAKQDSNEDVLETPPTPQPPAMNIRLNRGITFADEVPQVGNEQGLPSPSLAHIPEQRDMSKHIDFLERQQQNKNKGAALRIPGPRGFDRGEVPEELEEEHAMNRPLTRQSTNQSDLQRRNSIDRASEFNPGDHPVRRGITIDDTNHPAHGRERPSNDDNETERDGEHVSRLERLFSGLSHRRHRSVNLAEGSRSFARTMSNFTARSRDRSIVDPSPYLSWEATTGRNSAFLGLSQQQREELGGIEYRALKTLAGILLCYYFGFHILGMVAFLPWIVGGPQAWWRDKIIADGQSPAWWGIFTPASMFNDLGFTLTPDSMASFQYAVWPMLFGSFLIIIGNTGFPCMLRFIIWVMSKFTPRGTPLWEELRFLLDHPRRCFTLLFPSRATWWLFWVLVVLNGLDLIFFIILDLNDPVVTTLPPGLRVLNGWFQAASTRTAGFACVSLSGLHPAIQVSYLIMMYISVFPIAISVRRTNVYEEKSLGIFGGEEETNENGEPSYVGQHLRRQLSFDLWYIFLGFFIIAIVEGSQISDNTGDKVSFSMFSVLFEIVSAYGTVGLSLGYPNVDTSFSGQFHVISKLVIIAMMLRGRHRGLPYALDRAILLPSEKLQQKEAEDAEKRYRRGSIFAEGNEPLDGRWSDGELDEAGLPRQHGLSSAMTDPVTTGDQHLMRRPTRRGSNLTTNSQIRRRERSRSLGRFIAGGLGAGPTISKHD